MRLIDADAYKQALQAHYSTIEQDCTCDETYREGCKAGLEAALFEVNDAPTIEIGRKRESHAMLPCICGSKRREHWYSGSDKFPEELRCAKCGLSVKGRNATDVIRVWNMVIESELDMKAASGVGQAFSQD